MIETVLQQQMQWVTFEPNNALLWKEIDRAVRSFLDRLYKAGLLDGASPEDAYSVRCDETTNPATNTDTGRVTCLVGFQPPFPAEFVVVRVGVTRSGIQSRRGGPRMPKTAERLDPVPAFRFTVAFDDLPPGGFSDCTGLQSEVEVQEYAEGGLNTHTWKFAGRTKFSNVVVKRGIVDRVLWDWFNAISRGDFKSRNCTIYVHDPSGSNAVLEFQLADAFPAKWQGPELSAGQNNLAIETMEIAHHGLTRKT